MAAPPFAGAGAWFKSCARPGKQGVDRRFRSFQRRGETSDLGGDVVDALAQKRVLDPLCRPAGLGFAAHLRDFGLQLIALADRGGELGFDLGYPRFQLFDSPAAALGRACHFAAQIAFDFVRGFGLAAQPLDLVVPLGEEPALIAEARFQFLDTPAEKFGLGGLGEKLPLEFGGAYAKPFELAARVGQVFLCRGRIRRARGRVVPRFPSPCVRNRRR